MTALHAAAAGSGRPSDDQARQQVIDELAARLAAITSGGSAAAHPVAAGGPGARAGRAGNTARAADTARVADTTNSSESVAVGDGITGTRAGRRPAAAGGPGDGDQGGAPGRQGRPAGPVAVGASGTAGPTHPNRRRGDAAGHPEDDPGDPEAVARAICLRLLTGAARPRAGLAAALRLRGIPDDVADRVLDRFTEVGLIDDEAYAQAFVAAKHRERALGATALRSELRRKGVDEETVSHAVQVIDQDAERERARALIWKKVDAAMANGEQAARRRLVALLARRGYAPDVALAVVSEVLDARQQENEEQSAQR